jgi:hypothetical protein
VRSIDETRSDVQRLMREATAIANDTTCNTSTETEERLWATLLALGRALMTLYFARRAAQWLPSQAYSVDGRHYEVSGTTRAEVGTRFGKVTFEEPVGRVEGAPRQARDLPLRHELGLPGGFTMLVVTSMVKLCAQMAFASARGLHRDLFGWAPSPRAVLRMVDAAGAQARPFLEQAPPPEDDGDVLIISVDGKGAPAISSKEYERRARPRKKEADDPRHARRRKRQARPRVRRGPGKKSKNAKMAAVGALYTLRRSPNGKLDGPINKRVFATFDSYRALFEWLADEAKKRGYGTSRITKVLFVADGADVLWSLQAEFFPDALQCLDWFHAVEKLWDVGKALCRKTRTKRSALETWVAEQKKRLRKGQLQEIIDELEQALAATPVTGPGNKYRREVLGTVHKHFVKNAHRMKYAELRRQDLEISSGVIEGAVRHLVGVRLDGPGMRWSRDRAEAVLHLRCVLINGMWNDFASHLEKQADFRLKAQPVPTRTHDAIAKAA